ncbi:hypothetical protein ACFWB1_13295 [Streptomyces goshikiensis]|uniref:hypothetical protein n=1 Tax=Streptomyces goshikiensis TaxID=1942 RepID=UPI0036C1EED2
MRTALRTSIVTAALAGAMLVPAAGSAFAAPAPRAVTSTKAAASQAKRVVINKHLVADMINSATETPAVKIFIVNEDGTTRPKALASLGRGHTEQSVQGTVFTLTKAETAEPVLTVFENGVTTSFPLPKGEAAAPAPSENGRYAGQAVYIGNGMVAVLRNRAEGPEAWIRAVGPQWKPGDDYMSRVLTVLDRQQTTDSAFGASFKLTKAETTAPVLVVTTDGVAKSYPLPKGKAGQTCAADAKIQDIGAGTTAELYMSSNGPKVVLRSSGSDTFWRTLDRDFPALNKSDGIIARIVNASGSKPVFEWQTQGGGTPLGRTSFPSLPKGCELNYKVTQEQTGAKPAPKPSSATTGVTTQTQAQTPVRAQTAVVPKGAVAAGAELPVETVADTDDSTTLAAGAGLVAIVAALGAGVLRRRRNHG